MRTWKEMRAIIKKWHTWKPGIEQLKWMIKEDKNDYH